MPKKNSENHPKTKYPIQDTPEKERHMGVMTEHYESLIQLVLENLDTIKRDLRKDMQEFREEVYEKFALIDLRFDHLEKKIDLIGARITTTEKKVHNLELWQSRINLT